MLSTLLRSSAAWNKMTQNEEYKIIDLNYFKIKFQNSSRLTNKYADRLQVAVLADGNTVRKILN